LHEGNFINNYCIEPDFNFNKKVIKVIFISKDDSGKTSLINRLIKNHFLKDLRRTHYGNYHELKFEFNHNQYEINIWDTIGAKRFIHLSFFFLKGSNIVIYVIDLTKLEKIDEIFIDKIKETVSKEALIYLVGNKLDLVEEEINKYGDNLIKCRKKAKLLIENKDINFYFEVSAKNRKGINYLMKNIKWYILRNKECHLSNLRYCNILGKYMNM